MYVMGETWQGNGNQYISTTQWTRGSRSSSCSANNYKYTCCNNYDNLIQRNNIVPCICLKVVPQISIYHWIIFINWQSEKETWLVTIRKKTRYVTFISRENILLFDQWRVTHIFRNTLGYLLFAVVRSSWFIQTCSN